MREPIDSTAAGRWSLRRVILMAGLVVAGAALVVLMLGLVSSQDGRGATSTPSPGPIIFPTTTVNR